jgi:phosphoribosyl 1,2-cyclic phosphodiesterase
VKLRVWGCRGTIATPGSDTIRYGGNTSCVEVRLDDGSVIILDAGTGIRALGNALSNEPPRRIDLFVTHLHVDHVEGLGVFEPIWHPDTELHIWGPASPMEAVADRI